jgi:hypothetical protein
LATTRSFAFPTSRIVYARGEGAEACPAESTARKAVAARLGYDPFSPTASKTIVAEIARDHEELRGQVRLVDEQGWVQGAREFRTAPNDCDALVSTMALAISIAIDPSSENVPAAAPLPAPDEMAGAPAGSREAVNSRGAATLASVQTPTPTPGPTVAAAAKSAPDVDSTSAKAVHKRAPIDARAGVSMSTSFGTAPSPALGVAASFGFRTRDFSLTLEGRGDWSASDNISPRGSVRSSLIAGALAACFHRGVWFGCAVGTVGAIHASGVGLLLMSPADDALYGAGGGRSGLEIRLYGPIFLRPELELLGNFGRVELRVDNEKVWQASPLSARVGAGVFASFP